MATKYSDQIPIGKQFGSWTVLEEPTLDDAGRAKVTVKCVCGEVGERHAYNLVTGRTSQCKTCSSGLSPTFQGLSNRYMRSAIGAGEMYTLSSKDISESFSKQASACALTGEPLDIQNAAIVSVNDEFSRQLSGIPLHFPFSKKPHNP